MARKIDKATFLECRDNLVGYMFSLRLSSCFSKLGKVNNRDSEGLSSKEAFRQVIRYPEHAMGATEG